MLDAFINVINRLIQLVEIRKHLNRQMFEDHVAPIYKDLQLIIDDYRKIIFDIERKLKDPKISPNEVVEELIAQRKEYSRLRDEVKKYSTALSAEKPNNDVQEFALACQKFLTIKPPTVEARPSLVVDTPMISLIGSLKLLLRLGMLKEHHSTECLRRECSELIRNYSRTLDERWDKIASSYFNLRTKYLR